MLLVLIAGLFLLFPRLRRSEITFREEIAHPACVEQVRLDLFSGRTRARGHAERVAGRYEISHKAKLSGGAYEAVLSLDCDDGERIEVERRPITVAHEAVIEFNVSGGECRCPQGG